ncbi:CvpA family protein [Anaerosporobacter faecicola]|uniref:CvpA family protein n=1 Tax=Anaerosporobacter faecicola TaxID=2718714 RepID=UPI00143CBD54|nr:CvpA family protein [Anaerosporobacter faecicola]
MKKSKNIILVSLLVLLVGFVYYYIALPPINIHARGFWYFIISVMAIVTVICLITTVVNNVRTHGHTRGIQDVVINASDFKSKRVLLSFCATIFVILVFIIGSVLSSPIVNASKYQKLIQIETRDFLTDVEEISYNEIPLLDKDSATLLGSRKMGSMVEYVSQFEVSNAYTQINYNNSPVRVTPLDYGSFFKWISNRSEGIPAYIRIDMATQNVECIKLDKGIRYSKSDHFGRNLYRYLRFKYPTYIFDDPSFEIDDNGTPYWICPVKDYTIGLFGGETISRVVLVNAITGEHTNYKINEVPNWVDHVYSADLLISYYDYYGTLKHGYWNTLFSQKDCLKTTDGYNYIALDDDVWVYTGVTSVGGDESNVGFVLMNQRTAETRYYSVAGAEEYSAMSSAEGQVQNLGYKATFPLLLNINNEPTYFIALKDDAGLVKKYAMVNISKYQIVAIGDSALECEKTYNTLLRSTGITVTDESQLKSITGQITKIAQAVIDGNSHFYVKLSTSTDIFDVSIANLIDMMKYDVGSTITFTYTEGSDCNTVAAIGNVK